MLLYVCPHTVIYVSSYCYVCVSVPQDEATPNSDNKDNKENKGFGGKAPKDK